MKKSTVTSLGAGLFLALLLFASLLSAAETPPTSGPVAVMPETTFEFADVVDGETLVHDFVIQNQGDSVLTVLKVKTT